MRLRKEQIDEAPARARGAFDELQIFRAKNHGAQHTEVVAEFADRLRVEAQLPLGGGPIHFDLVLALRDHCAADEVTLLTVADHLRAADAAKRTQRGHQIDGFEDVRLALRVIAEQQMKARREIHVQPRVIAEITKP